MLGHVAGWLRWGGTKTRVGTYVYAFLSLDSSMQMMKILNVPIEVTQNDLWSLWLDTKLSKIVPSRSSLRDAATLYGVPPDHP